MVISPGTLADSLACYKEDSDGALMASFKEFHLFPGPPRPLLSHSPFLASHLRDESSIMHSLFERCTHPLLLSTLAYNSFSNFSCAPQLPSLRKTFVSSSPWNKGPRHLPSSAGAMGSVTILLWAEKVEHPIATRMITLSKPAPSDPFLLFPFFPREIKATRFHFNASLQG